MPVYKVKSLVQNVLVRGTRSQQNWELVFTNDQFFGESNDEIMHYGRTLIKIPLLVELP